VVDRSSGFERERIQTVVIGAGQAGLSVGYHLARRGLSFAILDANARVGDNWRTRWDSLRLFTPARYDGLAGMAFPASPTAFPTKNQMADYLESYATRFRLPIRNGVKVTRVSRDGRGYLVETGDRAIETDHVVVAMANYQSPRVPSFSTGLDPRITQLHSKDYRNPAQLQEGPVLIVGAGNSGAEIAIEAARSHQVWMSGRSTGNVPFRIESLIGRTILVRFVLRVLFHRILTVDTPMGRKVRPKVLGKGGPLIRTRPRELAAAGIERVARVSGVKNGVPVLEDGRTLEPANVVWCTGFHPGFSWIDLPVFDSDGEPKQERGMAIGEPGLYFVGLHFLYAFSSTMIHGVGRDADRVAATIAARQRGLPEPEERVRASEPARAGAIAGTLPARQSGPVNQP
jgi:putative flavoprotein involved in K+ transport